LLGIAALLVGCGETQRDADNAETNADSRSITTSEQVNEQLDGGSEAMEMDIPVVNAATLKALRRQAKAQGKVLVIDCWATWCPSCVVMFPHLHKAIKERGDGVIMASLCFDEGQGLDTLSAIGAFLNKHDAWDNAYQAAAGSDATDAIAQALSDNWGGNILPAVFVYGPDGTTAYEFLETRGEVQDWVDRITGAVDSALQDADDSPGQ
jgi:thiol-disulfide isomerase/thioredoxin